MATKGARFCCAMNCSNNSRTSVDPRTGQKFKFHRFPTDKQRCERWIVNLQRADLNLGNVQSKHVCSAHFEEVAYNCQSDIATSNLLPSAVPTLVTARTQSTRKPPAECRCPGPAPPPSPPIRAVSSPETSVTEASAGDELDSKCTKVVICIESTCLYSGDNRYLIHCRFCKFSHLQRMERSGIFIIGIHRYNCERQNL